MWVDEKIKRINRMTNTLFLPYCYQKGPMKMDYVLYYFTEVVY